jgi:hypothetical protein
MSDGGGTAAQRRPSHPRQGVLGTWGQRPRGQARAVGEGWAVVPPAPAGSRRRGEPARAANFETRTAAATGGAADASEGGDCGATLGTGAAIDVAGVVRGTRGATENDVCDGVGQLPDPLEGHVI